MEIVLLDEQKSINQLVSSEVDKSILGFIRSELEKDEYSFIVTADNLKFAKDKMADLNKSIKFITEFRKEKVNSESITIDEFKENVKEYIRLIDEKREQIKKDVDYFESETKKAITTELSLYLDELIGTHSLRDGFNKITFDDLVVLGAVTAKGLLTKKTCEVLEGRVMACKSKQDKYDMRLLQLENVSHRSGLESPLTITHVQGIIYLDDDVEYQSSLDSLMASEISRQNTIKENIRVQMQRDSKQALSKDSDSERERVLSIFHNKWNTMNMTLGDIQSKISEFERFDFSQFNYHSDFAKHLANEQIQMLKKMESALLQKSTAPANDLDSDKKIVTIKVEFAIKVPSTVKDSSVLLKVMNRLQECGIDAASIVSAEVVV